MNHWDRTSKIVSVEDPDLKYAGRVLKQKVWDAARSTIQEWTGQRLAECSLYGIRIYEEGAVLATHVDRLPLVSSAIINVDQGVDEPWPLEVIGHDGKAYNVTMVSNSEWVGIVSLFLRNLLAILHDVTLNVEQQGTGRSGAVREPQYFARCKSISLRTKKLHWITRTVLNWFSSVFL